MSQELVVMRYNDVDGVHLRTVLFAGDNETADAIKSAAVEVLTRANVAVSDVDVATGIRAIDRDATDDDTIVAGDEVTPASSVVVKATEQRGPTAP